MTISEINNDQNAIDIGVWENEGEALHRFSMHHHYGRRIEPNRSWTVYHVYTGLPADIGEALVHGYENERISIFDVVGYACLT